VKEISITGAEKKIMRSLKYDFRKNKLAILSFYYHFYDRDHLIGLQQGKDILHLPVIIIIVS